MYNVGSLGSNVVLTLLSILRVKLYTAVQIRCVKIYSVVHTEMYLNGYKKSVQHAYSMSYAGDQDSLAAAWFSVGGASLLLSMVSMTTIGSSSVIISSDITSSTPTWPSPPPRINSGFSAW